MASHDVREVLNLPSDHSAGPRPSKKQKISAPRPNLKGLAREVQNLGGDNPIAIVPETSFFKKRRLANKPVAKWELKPFANSARGDEGALILRHWRRKSAEATLPEQMQLDEDDAQQTEDRVDKQDEAGQVEDSAFAKFNVRVSVPQYSEDQYSSNLQNDDWTKEETDYLLALAKEYDLRWPIIWDRYDFTPKGPDGQEIDSNTAVIPLQKPRTTEELKARYYEVAAKMMVVQKPAQYMTRPEYELYETMLHFNAAHEKARKDFALNTMARSKEEAREEESLLLEVRRILARTERFNEERRELYNRLDYPHTETDISAFKSSTGIQTLLQNLMNVDKAKKRRSLIGPDGVGPAIAVPGSAISDVGHNRRESIAASASGHRDSIVGTPATPADGTPTANKKKGVQLAERRKLSEQEEQVYGVSHHDRLGSGPTFRYEKINKLYSHKSGQQQMRLTNALAELDVPSRLVMPTASVTSQFEHLWVAVTALVDLRKVADKLDAEIKVEEAKKEDREKARGGARGQSGVSAAEKSAGDAIAGATRASRSAENPNGAPPAQEEEATNAIDEAAPTETEKAADGEEPALSHVEIKEEEGEKEKSARPSSSGANKRSASVLSTTSDKSAKRLRK